MELPKITDIDLTSKRVLVRLDLDVPEDDDSRLITALPTLEYLVKQKTKIIVIGHYGRPKGKVVEEYSLKPVAERLENLLAKKLGKDTMEKVDMNMMENLRFNEGEEKNDDHFTKHLVERADAYVNEAFGNSHRNHASIVGLPKLLPSAAGFRFIEEVEKLSVNFKKPVVAVLGGVKKDKIKFINGLSKIADKILVGGRLPLFTSEVERDTSEVVFANLNYDKEDITLHSIEVFEKEIAQAATIILAGPMGKFEEEGHRQGTERVFKAISNSTAFKVAGGGDTEAVLSLLNLTDKLDWISVGGGSMLEFLASGSLPGLEALLH